MRKSEAQKLGDEEIRPLLKTDFVDIDYLGRRALPAFVASHQEDRHKQTIKRKRAAAVNRILSTGYGSFDADQKAAWEVIQGDIAKKASLWDGVLVQLLTRRFQQAEFDAFFSTCLPKIPLKKLLLVFELANQTTRDLLIDRVIETPKGINSFALTSMMATRDVLPMVIAGLTRNPASKTAELLFLSEFTACNRREDFERALSKARESAPSNELNTLNALTAELGGETTPIVMMFPGGSKLASGFGEGRVGGRGPDIEIDPEFEHVLSISKNDAIVVVGEHGHTTSLYRRSGSSGCRDLKVIQHDSALPDDGKPIAFVTAVVPAAVFTDVPTAAFSGGGGATMRAARSIIASMPGYVGGGPIWLHTQTPPDDDFVMQIDSSFGLDCGNHGFAYIFERTSIQQSE